MPQDQIAALIGIAPETLRKHYDLELGLGKAQASAAVAKTLFNKATVGQDTTAMIWWTKAQMRWSETVKQELTGKDGAPIVTATLDVSKLDIDVLRAIMAAKDGTE